MLTAAGAELDVGLRARAISLQISTTPAPAGGPWGPRGAWDPAPWVQRATIDALAARLPEQESRELLLQLTAREGLEAYTRCAAALHLAAAGEAEALPTIREAIATLPEEWLAAPCLLAAGQLGDAGAVERLATVLRDEDLPVELGFIEALGRSGLEGLAAPLEVAAEQAEPIIAVPLAVALLRLAPDRGRSALMALAGDPASEGDEPGVGKLEILDFAAPVVLGEDGPARDAALVVVERLASSTTAAARTYARLLLAGAGERDWRLLIDAARSSDREQRALAIAMLGEMLEREPPRSLQRQGRRVLLEMSMEPDLPTGIAVARALRQMGDPDAVGVLSAWLDAPDLTLQVEAAGVILTLTPRAPAS